MATHSTNLTPEKLRRGKKTAVEVELSRLNESSSPQRDYFKLSKKTARQARHVPGSVPPCATQGLSGLSDDDEGLRGVTYFLG